MSLPALKIDPEALLSAVIHERLDAVEEQARALGNHTACMSQQFLDLQTLGRLAAALSGFLRELDGELGLGAWVSIETRTRGVISMALDASRKVIARARSRGGPPSTLNKVLASAEAVRVLREDVILASLRAV